MKQSLRAKRMQRHHQRNSKVSKLSLVSLMDIFTILVFFLMVNASDVQVLQTNKSLELPESVSEEAAEDNLLIMVNATDVILQGRQIISVDELMALESVIVEPLNDELEYQKNRKQLSEQELENGLAINIMADKSVPYALLKKVMQTSASAGYTNISLAVEQVYANTDELLQQAEAENNGEAGQ